MGSEQKKVVWISWVFAIVVACVFSAWQTLIVGWAVLKHPSVPATAFSAPEPERTEFRREEQRYFLDFGIYIPMEDIMYVDELAGGAKSYAEVLEGACGGLKSDRGLAIWLPLKIKVPLIGERVKEWCWKPNIQA